MSDLEAEQSLMYLRQSLAAEGFESLCSFDPDDALTLRFIWMTPDRTKLCLGFVDERYVGLDISEFPGVKGRKLQTPTNPVQNGSD